jgi:Flp pilus assembly pilin Flp
VITIKNKVKKLCEKVKSKIRSKYLSIKNQRGQSTIEYALVLVIAGIISAILVAVGKPLVVDLISKVFGKIAALV